MGKGFIDSGDFRGILPFLWGKGATVQLVLMAREVLTEGIVLRRWYAGEYDKWVSLLTPEHGKLRVRVRGARKPTSKMGMLTEPLNRIRTRVIEGRAQKLLAQPHLIHSYVPHRTELERLSLALALCETLDRWLPEEHAEPEVYQVLQTALTALETTEMPELVAVWALWRWLALLGYCPDMVHCGQCGATLGEQQERVLFVPAEGVLLCTRCGQGREGVALSAAAVRMLQQIVQGEPIRSARPEDAQSLIRAALRYAESVLESPVRWLEFWERLNALRASG